MKLLRVSVLVALTVSFLCSLTEAAGAPPWDAGRKAGPYGFSDPYALQRTGLPTSVSLPSSAYDDRWANFAAQGEEKAEMVLEIGVVADETAGLRRSVSVTGKGSVSDD